MFIKQASRLLIIVLIASCSSTTKDNKYERDNTAFNNYLTSVFGLKIANDSTNYVLISDNGCHGCIEATITTLSNYNKTTFIVSNAAKEKYKNVLSGLVEKRVLVDTTLRINRLKYHRGNVGIIQTTNGHIFNVVNLDAVNLYKILRAIDK